MRTVSFFALVLALSFAATGRTAAQPKEAPKKPLELYALFRATMNEGKFDIAAIYLDQFLKSDPADADFLELEKKHGTTVFEQLRAVPKFSDDPAQEKKIRENVEELNKRAKAVATKLLYNPERVQKYIRNLGATFEEKVFAQIELRRTGEYAVPFMIDALRRAERDPALYAGLLETIPLLDGNTMAGWVAAIDGFGVDRQYGVIDAISRRRDAFSLLTDAQTDMTPYLWRILSRDPKDVPPNLRELALDLLNKFYPGAKADTKRPEAELVALARKFYEHKAKYIGAKTNPDGSPSVVPVWVWDEKAQRINRLPDVAVGQAEEYYGLRYLRWALDSKPDYAPAQSLILALAAERAVERSRYGSLATAEPAVYKLLADAPSAVLIDLLTRGLAQKRTTLVFATVQVLGDRADRTAATPPAGALDKPSLLVRALSYPDHAVQFAAATALLRSPVPVPVNVRPMIVDVLRRAAAVDAGKEGMGTVLMADPGKFRADANALLLRSFGFNVETYTTGRDLLRRISAASDFDMIFIDRHTATPELIDLIGQLQNDVRTAARPTYVVASSDKPRPPSFDQLLVRTAALIAATENDIVTVPAPYTPDPRATPDETQKARVAIQQRRDNAFRGAVAARTARLQRVLDTLPLTLTETQKRVMGLRIQMIQYAILGVEFPISNESSPETMAELDRVRKQMALQPPVTPYGTGIATIDLLKLIDRYELDVAKAKFAQEKYDSIRLRVDAAELGLTVETFRDPVLETKLKRTLFEYPTVKVISEPYSRLALEAEFKVLFADPMMIPRDAASRRADARAAVDYLKQMAVGDLPGYDLKSVEADLRTLLGSSTDHELVSAALDAVERFKSGDAQQALVRVALKDVRNRPPALRKKAADAVIRHVRANGNALTPELVTQVVNQSNIDHEQGEKEDAELRGKFLTLKGMLAYKPGAFVDQLKGYSPPIVPPVAPKKDPDPKPADPKP